MDASPAVPTAQPSPPAPKPELLDRLGEALRSRHYSRRTEATYRHGVIDFARNEILVRDGKGAKDWVTMLPESLKPPLQEHRKTVKAVHDRDLADGWGRVLFEGGYDIRTVQERLGHADVKTTMVYTRVLNRRPSGVRSPMDGL